MPSKTRCSVFYISPTRTALVEKSRSVEKNSFFFCTVQSILFPRHSYTHQYRRCEVPNCEIRPHYGYDGEAPRFCAQHRAEGMHNLRSRRCQVCVRVRFFSMGTKNTCKFSARVMAETLNSLAGRLHSKSPPPRKTCQASQPPRRAFSAFGLTSLL